LITSATWSTKLKARIAQGYIKPEYAKSGAHCLFNVLYDLPTHKMQGKKIRFHLRQGNVRAHYRRLVPGRVCRLPFVVGDGALDVDELEKEFVFAGEKGFADKEKEEEEEGGHSSNADHGGRTSNAAPDSTPDKASSPVHQLPQRRTLNPSSPSSSRRSKHAASIADPRVLGNYTGNFVQPHPDQIGPRFFDE
jgi:hypothetical protein